MQKHSRTDESESQKEIIKEKWFKNNNDWTPIYNSILISEVLWRKHCKECRWVSSWYIWMMSECSRIAWKNWKWNQEKETYIADGANGAEHVQSEFSPYAITQRKDQSIFDRRWLLLAQFWFQWTGVGIKDCMWVDFQSAVIVGSLPFFPLFFVTR